MVWVERIEPVPGSMTVMVVRPSWPLSTDLPASSSIGDSCRMIGRKEVAIVGQPSGDYPWVGTTDDRFTLALVLDVGEVLARVTRPPAPLWSS